jgi:hypothetical protein
MEEVTRKLASVRRIEAIDPIEGADNIVCATVDGWKVVTQKSNNFAAGDLVVYFEIDSFLPAIEKFEFLRKSSLKVMDNVEGFRLRTIKLRGQISQGLILPMSEFFGHDEKGWYRSVCYCYPEYTNVYDIVEGFDLTVPLCIEKWEAPLHPSLAGKARGNFQGY